MARSILQDLMVPTSILHRIEQVLRSITELVAETEQASQKRNTWILFHVVTYDPAMDDFKACKSSNVSRWRNIELGADSLS